MGGRGGRNRGGWVRDRGGGEGRYIPLCVDSSGWGMEEREDIKELACAGCGWGRCAVVESIFLVGARSEGLAHSQGGRDLIARPMLPWYRSAVK